jgi:hypothetical protein
MRSHGREPVDPARQRQGEPPQGGGMSNRHGREPMERAVGHSSTGMQSAGLSCTQPGDLRRKAFTTGRGLTPLVMKCRHPAGALSFYLTLQSTGLRPWLRNVIPCGDSRGHAIPMRNGRDRFLRHCWSCPDCRVQLGVPRGFAEYNSAIPGGPDALSVCPPILRNGRERFLRPCWCCPDLPSATRRSQGQGRDALATYPRTSRSGLQHAFCAGDAGHSGIDFDCHS